MGSMSNNMDTVQASAVLDYWFGPLTSWDRNQEASMDRHQFWWQGGPKMDEFIREQFGHLLDAVAAHPDPVVSPDTTPRQLAEQVLARIIVLSQFSRHIHRGSPKDISECRLAHWSADAFAQDWKARKLSVWLHEQGLYNELERYEKQFSYMPFVQSEVDSAIFLFRHSGLIPFWFACRSLQTKILPFNCVQSCGKLRLLQGESPKAAAHQEWPSARLGEMWWQDLDGCPSGI